MSENNERIRVFIGCGPRYEEPTNALICSILQNTDRDDIDIKLMEAWTLPDWSHWKGQPTEESFGKPLERDGKRVRQWVTPFSLFRYGIPACTDGEGYAIYLDCDMIVTGDIADLWAYRKPGKWCVASNWSGDCVTVMDCSATYFDFMKLRNGGFGDKNALRRAVQGITLRSIPQKWNSENDYVEGVTQLCHYTDMKSQPHRPYPEVIDYEPCAPAVAALYDHWVERSIDWQIDRRG